MLQEQSNLLNTNVLEFRPPPNAVAINRNNWQKGTRGIVVRFTSRTQPHPHPDPNVLHTPDHHALPVQLPLHAQHCSWRNRQSRSGRGLTAAAARMLVRSYGQALALRNRDGSGSHHACGRYDSLPR
jgi:hypothetical protein